MTSLSAIAEICLLLLAYMYSGVKLYVELEDSWRALLESLELRAWRGGWIWNLKGSRLNSRVERITKYRCDISSRSIEATLNVVQRGKCDLVGFRGGRKVREKELRVGWSLWGCPSRRLTYHKSLRAPGLRLVRRRGLAPMHLG